MGKVRRYGYVIEWFAADHVPRHVHVYDRRGGFLGRFDVDRMVAVEGWTARANLVKLIRELKDEGRL